MRPSAKCLAEGSRIRKHRNLHPTVMASFGCRKTRFAAAFAQNASPKESALFAAVQRPINGACLQEKATTPLWKTLPSWYLLAEQDRMINPEMQDFMAQRIKATLRRLDVDHTPIAPAPDRVVELLLEVGQSVVA